MREFVLYFNVRFGFYVSVYVPDPPFETGGEEECYGDQAESPILTTLLVRFGGGQRAIQKIYIIYLALNV